VNGSLPDQVRAALNAARKERDQPRTLLYSTLLSDLKNREIEVAGALDEPQALEVVRRAIKRRRESVEAYRAGGRTDLADREAFEIGVLEGYLPPDVSEDEIRALVREAVAGGAKDLGALMGRVMPHLKGRADGKTVNRIAREELAATS
jgi:uncharacterized protein